MSDHNGCTCATGVVTTRYEWRDTGHGPQLWSCERKCWVLWYGIGAIGIADETKAEIEAALNPCWGIANEALCAARKPVVCSTCRGTGIVACGQGIPEARCPYCGKDGCGPGVRWET